MSEQIESLSEPGFVIGAVSRATGIPPETIRVWERRYRLIVPRRDPDNRRYYSAADVDKLRLVKTLVDLGHAIGSIAGLDEQGLRALAAQHGGRAPEREAARVMVCGEMLAQQVSDWQSEEPMTSDVATTVGFGELERQAGVHRPQVLVVEISVVGESRLQQVAELTRRIAARRCVVVYGYAEAGWLALGNRLGLILERGPITRDRFLELCLLPKAAPVAVPAGAPVPLPPPRFSNEALARIAGLSTAVRCECPHHLADLLFRVHAFELYSADCQDRNEQDAAIHARLHATAGQARLLFEQALAFLIESEGLEVEST